MIKINSRNILLNNRIKTNKIGKNVLDYLECQKNVCLLCRKNFNQKSYLNVPILSVAATEKKEKKLLNNNRIQSKKVILIYIFMKFSN